MRRIVCGAINWSQFIQLVKISIDSICPETCTGMMIENYLSTNATYPITYGTAITVACDPEYDLLGSEVITCESGIVYSHSSRRPKCVNKGMHTLNLQNVPNVLNFKFKSI